MNGPERPCKRNFFILRFTKFQIRERNMPQIAVKVRLNTRQCSPQRDLQRPTEASSAPRCPVLRALSYTCNEEILKNLQKGSDGSSLIYKAEFNNSKGHGFEGVKDNGYDTVLDQQEEPKEIRT